MMRGLSSAFDQRLERFGRHDGLGQSACISVEGARPLGAAVEDGDPMPGLGDVEREVGPHGSKADQADRCTLCHDEFRFPLSCLRVRCAVRGVASTLHTAGQLCATQHERGTTP
jgi:hypothetical protein